MQLSNCLILGLCAALLALRPAGQQPAAWSELAVPTGVSAANLDGRGKLITYRDAGVLQVYSAVHRRWQATAASASAPLRLMNDCLLLQEGSDWTAFSAYTGQFATLALSPAAQLVNPIGQINDSILLVLDGTTLHAFSCFAGTWTSRVVTASTGVAVQRHVAILADGTLLGGMDAYSGQWHDTTAATAPQSLDCDGTAAIAIDAANNTLFAFSAIHGTWRTQTGLIGAQLARGDDWCLFWTVGELLAYSSITGQFSAVANSGATGVPFRRDLCAVLSTPAGFRAYSAIKNSFSPPLAPTNATVAVGEATALLISGLQVTGWSAPLATSATITLDSAAAAVGSAVATVVDNLTGLPHCYSGLRGTWHLPPAGALPQVPQVTATGALLQASFGAYAFSARTGNYVPLLGSSPALLGNDQSAIGAAWDGSRLSAFDGRTDSWRSVPRTGTAPPLVQIWRTSLFAIDGATAHGFGAQDGVWSAVTLPEPFANGRASSESSRVVTATRVFGHAPLPTTMTFAQFPEFRRVQPTGSTARFSIAIAGGGIAFLAAGQLAGTPTPIGGLGDLWLQTPLATVLLQSPPSSERATFALTVPADPALIGSQWGFQSLAVPVVGPPHLGAATALYLL